MPSIGSSFAPVQTPVSSGAADVTDDGGDDGASDVTSSGPAQPQDAFVATPRAPVALLPPIALPLPAAAGQGIANDTTPALAGPGFKPSPEIDVPWLSQDDKSGSYDAGAKGNCNTTCRDMMSQMGSDADGRVVPAGKDHSFPTGVVDDDGKTSTDAKSGRLNVDPKSAQTAKNYLDAQLDMGNPVMVGVNRRNDARNDDGVTDHFVVVTGRGVDEGGRVYYKFNDPAARSESNGGDDRTSNRFFVDDKTGLLFRPGTDGNLATLNGRSNPNYNQRYEVSQVRQNSYVAPEMNLTGKQ